MKTNKKQNMISSQLKKQLKTIKKNNKKQILIITKNRLEQIEKFDNKQAIYIYDIGFNKTGKIFPINNHINKTGTNPLRRTYIKNPNFYDITNIYISQKEGKIAECFGDKLPTKKAQHIQGRFLCNYAILAYCAGFKKIYGFIID